MPPTDKDKNLSFLGSTADDELGFERRLRSERRRVPCLDDIVIGKVETEEGRTLGEIKEAEIRGLLIRGNRCPFWALFGALL